MAKQKIVMKVMMKNDKKTRKAMAIAATAPGVESVAFVGPDKDQIAVIGDEIDSVELTCLLRKRIGCTELVSVDKIEEKKPEKPEVEVQKPVAFQYPHLLPPHNYHVPFMPLHGAYGYGDSWSNCSIL